MSIVAKPFWAPRALELLSTQRHQQIWLANAIGVSQSEMTRLLNGKRRIMPATLQAVATALGVPVSWLEAPLQ